MLNVHSLEDNLAEYPGLEEDIVKMARDQGVGFVQLRCPETRLHGIERLPMPKDTYDKPKIRENYKNQAKGEVDQLKEFVRNGAEIVAIIGAEASPSCGIHYVAKWKPDTPKEDRKWPDTVDFVAGRGVFMEELLLGASVRRMPTCPPQDGHVTLIPTRSVSTCMRLPQLQVISWPSGIATTPPHYATSHPGRAITAGPLPP